MLAAVYRKHQAKQVEITQIPKPTPKDDEALVRIHMASVNALDYRSMRMGILRNNQVMGADIAGVVESAGHDVKQLKAGDAVFGDIFKYAGGFAEFAAVPEHALAKIPMGVTFEQAAALPVPAITALQALQGGIGPGQRVMICGAGGGVGTYAVQLAKYFGAKVTAVCGAANLPLVKSLGADTVIDYRKGDIWIKGGQYDLIVAVNGSYPFRAYKAALKSDGRLVVLGGALSQIFKAMLLGPLSGNRITLLSAKPNATDLQYLEELVRDGHIRPIIEKTYPLEHAAEAIQYLSQGHARGKVMISIAEGSIL